MINFVIIISYKGQSQMVASNHVPCHLYHDCELMYEANMTCLGKSTKAMSHLKFNMALKFSMALTRVFIRKCTCFTPKATIMVGGIIPNHGGLHYSMQWIGISRKKRCAPRKWIDIVLLFLSVLQIAHVFNYGKPSFGWW